MQLALHVTRIAERFQQLRALAKQLAGHQLSHPELGGALFDVSASRVAWVLSGPSATDVLAKGCPLDFHRRAFSVGACAQSVYGHVEVLVAMRDETPTFTLMVERSFARDVDRALGAVAAQYGFDALAERPYG